MSTKSDPENSTPLGPIVGSFGVNNKCTDEFIGYVEGACLQRVKFLKFIKI